LSEYRNQLATETGILVHPWTVGRALQRLGLTQKKKTLRASEQDDAAVAAADADWRVEAAGVAPERLVFIDETAALTIPSHASIHWLGAPNC
jgi:hypothetical protein